MANIQPQVLAIGALYAKALAHVLGHAARHHIAGGKFGFFRLVIGHKAVFVHVQQGAAVAAAAFCDQNVRGHGACGVKLHGFHIAQGHNARFKGRDLAAAVTDDGIGGGPVNTAITARGDKGCLGEIAHQFAGAQIAGNAAHAALSIMNQGLGLHAVMHVNAQLQQAVIKGEQHGVACAVRGITGAPFGRAAKGAGVDQPLVFLFFRCLKGLAALVVGVFTGHNAAPGNAHPGHFAHGDGACLGKQAGHFLVAAPVGAFDRIVEVHLGAVALAHDGVAQRRLHAAHGG